MRFSDLLILSTRMFKARTSRTILTILGMSIGIGAILFLVSMGYGLQKTILERITTSDSLLTLDVTEDKSSAAVLNEDSLGGLKNIPGVGEMSPSFHLSGKGKIDGLTADLSLTVTDPTFMRLSGIKMNQGVSINDNNYQGVVISSMVARIFGKNEEELIGKELAINISKDAGNKTEGSGSGLKETNAEAAGYESRNFVIIGTTEGEDNSVYVNSGSIGDVIASHFDQVKIKCNNSKDMSFVREQIIGKGFLVSSISETVDQANKIFGIVKFVLMLFGIIALIVSAIGMFNTMTIALLERTEEIGIMKSIGASDSMVSMIFIMESTMMGFLGGIVGVAIGWIEGQIFNGAVNILAHYFGGEKVNLFYSPLWFVMSILIFSAFVGFVTGVIPARRASRIDPLDALRYK
ncbi:MAG: FtsX-like permease family protein [Candidatus Moranbacteria bacterium]|nr:FtsX-like permease family protein [Candidatus Moranbacteria bacterium]